MCFIHNTLLDNLTFHLTAVSVRNTDTTFDNCSCYCISCNYLALVAGFCQFMQSKSKDILTSLPYISENVVLYVPFAEYVFS